MKLSEQLYDLFNELSRIQPNGVLDSCYLSKGWIPNFVTASNQQQIFFNKNANILIEGISGEIYNNDSEYRKRVNVKRFLTITRQCIANCFIEVHLVELDVDSQLRFLKLEIKKAIENLQTEFTHYLPAWTFGVEVQGPFSIGPVTILTREQWIDDVEFHPVIIDRYQNKKNENLKWKSAVHYQLKSPNSSSNLSGISQDVWRSIKDAPSILKVFVPGYELELSKQVATMVSKSALDAISLLFLRQECFHQQWIHGDRVLPKGGTYSMVEAGGYLNLPGWSLGPHIPMSDIADIGFHIQKNSQYTLAVGSFLSSEIDPNLGKCPSLSKRWLTALNWMAEGCREANDAVAIAKLATSLDVLSCGGRAGGILKMLTNLLEISEGHEVITSPVPKTLKKVVDEVYREGRSQILHGTKFDRLEHFGQIRGNAFYLTANALAEAAIRLFEYSGPDLEKAFHTMPKGR